MFLNEFNYPNFLIPHSNKKFVNKEIIKGSVNYLPILKEYQSKIFYDMIKHLETPNYRSLIQMPTGSGKTRTAMEIACHFLNNDHDYQVVSNIRQRTFKINFFANFKTDVFGAYFKSLRRNEFLL